jgi:hypothetical protein
MLENFGAVVDGCWRRQAVRDGSRGWRRRETGKIMTARIVSREQAVLVARCMLARVGVLAGLAGQFRAATYLVDQAAPGAADTKPGTEEKRCKTVAFVAMPRPLR